MALRCKNKGCGKGESACRCKKDAPRLWQADVWVAVPGEALTRRKWITSPQAFTNRQAMLWYGGLRSEAGLRPEERRLMPVAAAPTTVPTFGDASSALLADLEKESAAGIIRPTTFNNHVSHVTRHLNPRFGARPLDTIDVAAVKDLALELAHANGLKSRTRRGIQDTLGMVFGAAMDRGWIERNPVARLREAGRRRGGARLLKKDARPPMPLTEAELLLLEEVTRAEPPRARLPVMLMAFCGLRRGEALGLQRRDLDADGWLRIERIIAHKDVTSPKANSGRVQPVPDWLAEELRAFLRERKVAALDGTDWMFSTREGRPLFRNVERTWHRMRSALASRVEDASRRAQLAGLHMHDLRHTYQTLGAEKGVSAFTCQALMGHATVQMTGHYTKVSTAAKRAAAALLPVPHRCVTVASGG